MAGRFDRQIATAKRLIAKNGEEVVATVRTTTQNPTEPWQNIVTTQQFSVFVCFLPLTAQAFATISKMADTEVPKGAVQGLMGAVPFDVDDTVTFDRNGVTYAINYFDTLAPNGQKILHTMVLGS